MDTKFEIGETYPMRSGQETGTVTRISDNPQYPLSVRRSGNGQVVLYAATGRWRDWEEDPRDLMLPAIREEAAHE